MATNQFEYDKNGNLVEIIDARGQTTQYRYDALNRRRAIIYPDESKFLSDYDPDGHIVHTTDNNGLQRHYTVDELGRTTRVVVDKSSLLANVTVEGATFEKYNYDGLDRSVRGENDFALCEIQFNSLGWPLAETITFTTPDAPFNTPLVVTRQFNDVGALTDLTYPSGRRVHFGRDELNRLNGVQNLSKGTDYPGNPATPDDHDVITRIEYAGRQRSLCLYGNGTTTTYSHDGAARLIEVNHASPFGPLLRIQYLFDAVGNVRIRHDISPADNIAEKFAYDSFYRLTNESTENRSAFDPALFEPVTTVPPDPIPNRQAAIDALIGPLALPPKPHTYDYDLVGNRDREKDGSEIHYEVNALDQYFKIDNITTNVTTDLEYDANGNLKNDGQLTYTYDSLNRLVQVAEGGAPVAELFHDARGRRILELQNGQSTHFVWDGDDIIAEYRTVQLFAQYVHDDGVDRPVQIVAEGSEHWYHTDQVGSVRLLTDSVGNEAVTYRYSPFGKMTVEPTIAPYNPLRYTGRRLDKELTTYDYRVRQYDPQLGRFLQRDPREMVNGTNIYVYTANNPLAFTDSSGTGREETNKYNPFGFTEEEETAFILSGRDIDIAFDEASELALRRYKEHLGLKEEGWRLPGTKAGEEAAQYYADLWYEGDKQGGFRGLSKKIDAWAGGFLASLWTEETAEGTAVTLGTAGLGAAAQAGCLGAASLPIARALAITGSFQTGVSLGEAATGTSITGQELSGTERWVRFGFGAVGALSLVYAAVEYSGLFSSKSTPSAQGIWFRRGLRPEPTLIPPNLNRPGTPVGRFDFGRYYSGHAYDRMMTRGLPPSVVENTIRAGEYTFGPGSRMKLKLGTTDLELPLRPYNLRYQIPETKTKVIVDVFTGRVVSLY